MSKQRSAKIIMGVDPGTVVTGYGIIAVEESRIVPLDYGCIRPPARLKLSDRYLIIFEALCEILDRYAKEDLQALVVETQYVKKNVQSAIKLGMARGVVMLAAKLRAIPVFGYTPSQAKLAAVGRGSASKYQVQGMVMNVLGLASPPEPEDAADALALAICHAHAAQQRLNPVEEL
jgi:crossover junction endodeoxyribonuclease RuvC